MHEVDAPADETFPVQRELPPLHLLEETRHDLYSQAFALPAHECLLMAKFPRFLLFQISAFKHDQSRAFIRVSHEICLINVSTSSVATAPGRKSVSKVTSGASSMGGMILYVCFEPYDSQTVQVVIRFAQAAETGRTEAAQH
ncbi:hypothetical protein [Prosthecobacter sp.]|uniref:hypothetical protein n=1 Tax=Prosthecobacter sp. TaxID=1965333 RepID=UPI003783E0FE